MERGVPSARLVGLKGSRGSDEKRVQRLTELGILRRGAGDLSWLLTEGPLPTEGPIDLASALDEDRDDGV